MLRPRQFIDISDTILSVFFHFRTTRSVVVVREVADREVADREVADREVADREVADREVADREVEE